MKWYKEYETLKQNPLYATENSTNVRLTPSAKKIRNNGDEEIEPTPNALKRKSSLLEMISSPSSGRTSKKKDPRSKLNFLRPNSTRIDSFSIDESVGSATFVSSSDKTTSMPIDSAKSAFDFLKKLRQCDAIKASDTEQGQEEIDQSLVARPVTPGRQARRQIQSRTSPSRHADLFSPVTRPGQALRIDCISTNSTLSLGFNERLQQALFSPSPKKSGKEAEVTESKLIVESENDKDLEGKLEEFHEEEEADDLKPPAFDDDEPIQLENEFDNSHQVYKLV